MEHEGRDGIGGGGGGGGGDVGPDGGGAASRVGRSQNVAYVMPHDWASIARFLAPVLQRVDESSTDPQVLAVTSNDELAAAVAAAAAKLVEGRNIAVIAATSARRAARLLRIRPAQLVAGTPDTLVELLKGAALKLETVRVACIAWADEVVDRGALDSLETLMSEVPKDSARVVVTSELTPAVEELLERYARRARRELAPAGDADVPVNLEYVTVSSHTRLRVLRRLLDELDPRSAVVFARAGENETQARDLLRALGYSSPDAPVTVGLAAPPGTDLVVLFDLPATREALREAAGAAQRAVALVEPSQVASLRSLAAGGSLKPLTLRESGARAREREARIRDELVAVLESSQFARELLSLEPLLDRYDGLEIAAAAVQLLERARAERSTSPVAGPAASAAASSRDRETGPMARLYVNVGGRDNVRPGDLVGAIANEAGIASSQVGKIDVRDSHSVVEVAASVADVVIERVTGTPIRGRRAIVRHDTGSGKRDAGSGRREVGSRERRPADRSDRPRPRPTGRGRDDESGSREKPRRSPASTRPLGAGTRPLPPSPEDRE